MADILWTEDVPEDFRTKAKLCFRNVLRRSRVRDVALVVVSADAGCFACVSHRSYRRIPELFRQHTQMRHIIVAPVSLFREGERVAEAVLAHELGHVASRHFGGLWYVPVVLAFLLYRIGFVRPARALLLRRELSADRYAARLGYGPEFLGVLLRSPTPESRTRAAVLMKRLAAETAGSSSVPVVGENGIGAEVR